MFCLGDVIVHHQTLCYEHGKCMGTSDMCRVTGAITEPCSVVWGREVNWTAQHTS